jgi:uncharacterized RmlC-like cupin family protein
MTYDISDFGTRLVQSYGDRSPGRAGTLQDSVVSELDRRLSAACVPLSHIGMTELGEPGRYLPSSDFSREISIAGQPVKDIASPRLVSGRLVLGHRLVVRDVCQLWPRISEWCRQRGHRQLSFARDPHGRADMTVMPADTRARSSDPSSSGFANFAKLTSGGFTANTTLVEAWPSSTLEALTGDAAAFMGRIWGRTFELIHGAMRPCAAAPVGLPDLEYLIDHDLDSRFVYAISNGSPVRLPILDDSRSVDPAGVVAALDRGSTVVIDAVHHLLPGVAELCARLQLELQQQTQANVYVTPPNAQGLKMHSDPHDTLIIHLSGTKEWSVWNRLVDHSSSARRDPDWHFRVYPGDVVYIPRGFPHVAECTNTSSVHLTIGIRRRNRSDVRRDTLRLLANSLQGETAADEQEIRFWDKNVRLSDLARDFIPDIVNMQTSIGLLLQNQDRDFVASLPISARGCILDLFSDRAKRARAAPYSYLFHDSKVPVDGRWVKIRRSQGERSPDPSTRPDYPALDRSVMAALRVIRCSP